MQFVPNGPEIPASLLQAHEDRRVVFFCGAGISYPAKLPGFRDLVLKVYEGLEESRVDSEVVAFCEKRYDSTLGLLSERVGKEKVRREVARVLMPKKFQKAALATHQALLTLAFDKDGDGRLITTNFDRLFEKVIKAERLKVQTFSAPLLPIPKASKWNGLVYLHGLLPKVLDDALLLHLVITSADFGLAYLTERWAARFASELFRNFVVCFVGYSIADPILRYMMDALAADRSMGEGTNKAYAFGSFEGDHEARERQSWKAKGVIPILYKLPTGTENHDALHKSLVAWAATYRDGVSGREQLIARYAINSPAGSTADDNFAGRILWALSHPSGLPARLFAELNPVPPLPWLQEFEKNCYDHEDLPLFKVSPDKKFDEKLRFSLIRRPTPYSLGEYMSLFQHPDWNKWDKVMTELARWLTRHMGSRDVILWAVGGHGRIHPNWCAIIANHLKKIDELKARKAEEELQRRRDNAPSSNPSPFMRSLWRAAIGGRVCTRNRLDWFDIEAWLRQTKLFGLTATLQLELRNMLGPKIEISKSTEWKEKIFEGDNESVISLENNLDWEIVVALKHPWHTFANDLQQKEPWRSFLPVLLTEFTMLLREALDLMQELGRVKNELDDSHYAQASIAEHTQNHRFKDWTVLIELTRDAWLATLKRNPEIARGIALTWWGVPYATFKRLALFAATKADDKILDAQAIDWLLSDGARWLWEDETLYEVIRVLVEVTPRTTEPINARLQQTILAGPSSDKYRQDIEAERLAVVSEHAIWLRLAKMASVKQFLIPEVSTFLASMEDTHPNLKISRDDRDEFAFWMGTGFIGEEDDEAIFGERLDPLPAGRLEIVAWLRTYPNRNLSRQDGWRQRCGEDFATTSGALSDLASNGEWFRDRWHEALQAWAEPGLITDSWNEMAPLVMRADDILVSELSWPISHWLAEVAYKFEVHQDLFIALCARLLKLTGADELPAVDQIGSALNHPIGQVTEAYFRWWYRKDPRDAQGLESPFNDLFGQIADTTVEKFRHGRVFLAKNAVSLFRVDEAWARNHLLGLFNWGSDSIEAISAWKGFLWTPQLYWPFLTAVEPDFLATANHYQALGKHGQQYVDLLTFAALDGFEFIAADKLKSATRALPIDALSHAADTLVRAVEGSGNKTQEFWEHRVKPYFRRVWPTIQVQYSNQIADENARLSISSAMARLSIAASDSFPQALELVMPWLMRHESSDYAVHLLAASDLAAKFPLDALRLLVEIVDVGALWAPSELRTCLDAIGKAAPDEKETSGFRALDEFGRIHQQ